MHFNYKPNTSIEKGVSSFIDWYRKYYKVAE
jgi:UDP-glucuronate 4-epimerase